MPSSAFTIEPRRGVLQPNQFQLLTAKFSPSQPNHYTEVLRCILNNSPANVLELLISGKMRSEPLLSVKGIGAQPELQIENNGSMYFKPTCIGVMSKRSFTLKNTSRIPIAFEVTVATNSLI
jgi:hypothetical protein